MGLIAQGLGAHPPTYQLSNLVTRPLHDVTIGACAYNYKCGTCNLTYYVPDHSSSIKVLITLLPKSQDPPGAGPPPAGFPLL